MSDLPRMLALIYLSTLPFSVLAHPDLMLQIESLGVQIEANPGNTELLIKRGDLYRRHEDYPSAARDLAAVRKVSPDNTLLDFYEGHLLFDSGDAAAADVHFKKYLKNYPGHAKAWALRGKANIRLKQAEPAAGYFEQAIHNTASPSPTLYRSLILALVSSGENKWDKASQVVDEGLRHFGLEVSLLGLGIDIALANNQALKAMQYLDSLPDALRALPQWKTRIEATGCVASTKLETSALCQRQARDHLANEVTSFMTH